MSGGCSVRMGRNNCQRQLLVEGCGAALGCMSASALGLKAAEPLWVEDRVTVSGFMGFYCAYCWPGWWQDN